MAPGASLCDECGKKFKVFTKKKRCKHCMDVMCKSCYAAHLELKHTDLGRPAAAARRRHSLAMLQATLEGEEDVQFLSPVNGNAMEDLDFQEDQHQHRNAPSPDVLEGVDNVEVVSEEEEEEEEDSYGDRDGGEEELLLGAFARRASFEEDESQHRELLHIQEAVAKWASREMAVKKQQRLAKLGARAGTGGSGGVSFVVPPVPAACRSLAGFQDSDLFELLYAIAATVAVWAAFALAYAAYLALRRDASTVLLSML